ncbi:type II toxin-antitoxin system RelE/ParE family toxin [Sandaracinobacteroides saxicola]|uniref:Type II toxin-antitoxin system RelE/ParE family toxin n=1 Tax=Sandaracinobacteroides saxicola TaxID=2759707 RepID=A0A7G5IGC1_9SPHN|nr:type II toxin-antitoxin system RelE/ParE family toxin [Sandaracinobacteroides saxicola]QMW22413.1 type II toxin-antitoxin system RelE/ParE family toxin [Sandaracinobacteroides saxicola]
MIDVKQTRIFADWLRDLRDARARDRIELRLARIAVGHFGDVKRVGRKLIEARVDYGPGYRVYLVRRGQKLVVLLCGGDKSSQQRDIAAALAMIEELD